MSCILTASCQRELDCFNCENPPGRDTSGTVVKSEWQFDEAANHYNGPVDTAYLTTQDAGQLITITGSSGSGSEIFFVSIKTVSGSISPGTYTTKSQQVKFYYYTDGDTLYAAVPYYGGNISVTITAIDSNKVQGIFSGSAIDHDQKTREITNGIFSSPLKFTAADQGKGSVILWAKQLCNGPIQVKVNNVPGQINRISLAPPDCEDQQWPNFNIDTGTYRWVAYCGRDSVFGNVVVKPNNCSKILVHFDFMPPDTTITTQAPCKLSSVSYNGCLFLQCDVTETYEAIPNNVSATFLGQQVSGLQYTSFAAGFPVPTPNPVTIEADKIFINRSTEKQCYFITDASGRVIEYYGMKHPEVIYPLEMVVVKYKYDNAGNLITRTVYNADGTTAVKEINYLWRDGNIIQTVLNNLAGGGKIVTDFEYYTDKTVKQYPFVFTDAFELLLFQPAINTGNYMKNPVKTQVVHAVDINGNPVNLNYNYTNYRVDDNDYVTGFSLNYGNASTIFSFAYTCF